MLCFFLTDIKNSSKCLCLYNIRPFVYIVHSSLPQHPPPPPPPPPPPRWTLSPPPPPFAAFLLLKKIHNLLPALSGMYSWQVIDQVMIEFLKMGHADNPKGLIHGIH